MLLSFPFNGHFESTFFKETVKWRNFEAKKIVFRNQKHPIKNFPRQLISPKRKLPIWMSSFKNWFYRNSILSKSKFEFSPNKVVHQSFLSCQKLRDIGTSYELDFDSFDIKIKYHSKNARFYNNGMSLDENKIHIWIKSWCYPVIIEDDWKKSTKRNKNLTKWYNKKFKAAESIRVFSKTLDSSDLFLIDIDQITSRIFITKLFSNSLGSFTIFNFKLENYNCKNWCKVNFLLEIKKNIFFKPSWIIFSSILSDVNTKFKNSTFKKIYSPLDKSSFVLSSFKFISKKDYFNLFQKITSLWNFPLCMVHLNYFSDQKIDLIIFIPRYPISSFLQNEFSLNSREFFFIEKNKLFHSMEMVLPKCFSFSTGVIKTQTYFKSKKGKKEFGIKKKIRIKKEVSRKIILLLSNFAIKNPIGYNFLWMTQGVSIKKNLISEPWILLNFSHLLRFSSTKSSNTLISLQDYVSNFKKDQKEIYYIHLKKKTNLKSYSELEILIKNDVEVLILTEKIEEILLKMVEKNQKIWKKKRLFFIEVGSIEFYETLTSQINLKSKEGWIPDNFLEWFSKEITKNLFEVQISYNTLSSFSDIVIPKTTIKSNPSNRFMSYNNFFYRKKNFLNINNRIILKINGSNNLIRILNHHLKTKKSQKFLKEIGNLVWEISIIKSEINVEIGENFLKRIENILTLFLISITQK